MIDEGRARELLGIAGRDAPVGVAPIEVLVRRGRQSLWRRRAAPALAVAVIGAVVFAGRGFGAPTAEPRPVEPVVSDPGLVLNTSDWEPGDDAMRALGGGVLAVDDDGCLYVPLDDVAQDIVWPAGYTATHEPDGRVVVRRPDGQIVAAEGAEFKAGGGYLGPETDLECRAANSTSAFAIQDVMSPIMQVDLPDVVGQTQWEAEDVLANADLDVGVIYDQSAIGPGVPLSTVIRQEPAAGFVTEAFERVTLWVAAPDPEADDPDRALADAMLSFADGADPPTVAFAAEVVLALGEQEQRTVSREQAVARGNAWVFEPPGGAPVSILEELRSLRGNHGVSIGPHRRCADPPIESPEQLADLRQLSIQPWERSGCTDWFAVDLFLNGKGEIAGVVLDRWEP